MSVPFFQVYGLLDTLITDMMVLADELSPLKSVEEPLHFLQLTLGPMLPPGKRVRKSQ